MTTTPSTAIPPEVTAKWPHGLTLARGSHEDDDDEVCLLEAVAYFQGQPHTDRPPCVSPVLGAMGRRLNDALPDDKRQLLVPLIPLLPGTTGDGHDLPAWLDHIPSRHKDATKLRELGEIADRATAIRVRPLVHEIRASVRAADAAADAAYAAYALRPTVEAMQLSAIDLFWRITLIGRDECLRWDAELIGGGS